MKKIRVCELFSGYGSQCQALINIGYEIHPDSEIVEWGVNQAIAYNVLNIYRKDGELDHSQYLGSLSNDTKKPAKKIEECKIPHLNEALKQSDNKVDVTKYELGDKEFDLLTYSFPCQDISIQGKQKGLKKGSGTRSGLVWEVERLIKTAKHKPKYLLMENVKALLNKTHIEDFKLWIEALEELGYKSSYHVFNSKDFGVPQNRNRVFMLSVLDDKGELEKFDNLVNLSHKSVLGDILIPNDELENSPWPIDEKDHYLNEFELLPGQSGNYKLGKHKEIDDKVYSKMDVCNRVNKPSFYSATLMAEAYLSGTMNAKTCIEIDGKPFVRFLRPLEKARLMGLRDEQFWALREHPVLNDKDIEKMLGNSIVINVLEEIFKCLKI